MKGEQRREEPMFACVRLEDLVPEDHLLRKIDRCIDFSVVHGRTKDLYSHTGRPSVDPEVLIRMMVIGYLYGITSERRLCEEVHLNLAYRWFCGLSLEEKVPDHSTFSKNRYGRFAGTDLFRELFVSVVEQAKGRGLVSGKHLTVDATTVKANASLESLEPIVVPYGAEEFLGRVEAESESKGDDDQPSLPNQGRKLSNETHRSRTDPDARLHRKKFERPRMAYSDNVLMDNRSRVIVDVEVTEPTVHEEGQAAGQMLKRSRFAVGIDPQTVAGDKAYGAAPAVEAICEAGVTPHVPRPKQRGGNREGIFEKSEFLYDADADEMLCPAGHRLRPRTFHKHNGQVEYRAQKAACGACELKPLCTRSACRVVNRHRSQDSMDYAARQRGTAAYRLSQRHRKRIEMLFGEAKEFMGLRTARRRGRANVLEQCLLTATVQNIKRIVVAIDKQTAPISMAAGRPMATPLSTICRALVAWWRHLLIVPSHQRPMTIWAIRPTPEPITS